MCHNVEDIIDMYFMCMTDSCRIVRVYGCPEYKSNNVCQYQISPIAGPVTLQPANVGICGVAEVSAQYLIYRMVYTH